LGPAAAGTGCVSHCKGRVGYVTAATEDVVALLKADYRRVEEMFSTLDALDDSKLVDYFCHVREELVRHETAEELVVYPAFRRNVPGGDFVADACIAEQSEAEETLARFERHGDEPVVLRAGLLQLRRDVRAHAQHEEEEVFPALEAHIKVRDLQELAKRYAKALESAPAHTHPHAPETPPGNVVLAPIEAVRDRIRDAMKSSA
jgi:hemerythrin superfamily protein